MNVRVFIVAAAVILLFKNAKTPGALHAVDHLRAARPGLSLRSRGHVLLAMDHAASMRSAPQRCRVSRGSAQRCPTQMWSPGQTPRSASRPAKPSRTAVRQQIQAELPCVAAALHKKPRSGSTPSTGSTPSAGQNGQGEGGVGQPAAHHVLQSVSKAPAP